MPYPNEHSCRLIDPAKCRDGSFRRENNAGEHNGRKYDVIFATLDSSGETVRQSNRYPTATWSESEARRHCDEQDSIKFEPAAAMAGNELPQIMNQSWAISEVGLTQVEDAAANLGTVQAIMARSGTRPQDSELTQIRDGVAVIEIIGPIFHYDNILSWIFGFPSAEGVLQEIRAAEENPQVEAIVLQVDSPGGQVGGITELAGYIKNTVEKPVFAFVGDYAASAAYWIASAADEIVAADTAEFGSIGVVISARRRSDNTIEIVSKVSPKKRPDPGTDEGRQVMQDRADDIADVFVETVMANRKLTREQVTDLQGNMVIARKAINAGLVDRIGSLEGLIAEINNNNIGVNIMDLQTLKTEHAELYEQVMEAGRTEARQDIDKAKTDARQEGQKQTVELVEVVFGEDTKATLDQVIQTGMTAEQVKVSRDIFGKKADDGDDTGGVSRKQILDGIESATGDTANKVEDTKQDTDQAAEFDQAVAEYQTKNNCKKSQAIQAIATSKPELHQAWLDAQQKN